MRKALVVGINKYPDNPLNCCHNDANEISKLLECHGNHTKNFDVNLKLDIESDNLKELIKECFIGSGDVALFYFSGHGYNNQNRGYLIASDGKGVEFDFILETINSCDCKYHNVIIILDTCYSGQFGNYSYFNDHCAHIKEGVTILTSSHATQYSIENSKHGVFTSLLIDALSGSAADIIGNITPGGIYAFIDKALGAWEQRPIFKTNITRFISLRVVNPQVQLSVIKKIPQYFQNADSLLQLDPSFEKTNNKRYTHKTVEPYTIDSNVAIFEDLQDLESIGLVVPCDTKHMYYAAIESKFCKLTPIGQAYWHLVKNKKL